MPQLLSVEASLSNPNYRNLIDRKNLPKRKEIKVKESSISALIFIFFQMLRFKSFEKVHMLPSVQKYAQDTLKFSAHNYEPVPVVFKEAKGCVVKDIDGKEYLDFLSAYSAVNQGHCHPRILEALKSQLERVTLSSRAFLNDQFLPFCQYLSETFKYEKVLPMNTGVEGGETAIKLARRWGYRVKKIPQNEGITVFARDNFWGRTLAAVSSSTDPSSYEDFGPFMPGFEIVNYDDITALESLFKEKGKYISAFMVEPIQGEAGVKIPSDGYLKRVRELCTEFNVLLIADEVQTGLGRTGYMLACEYDNVRPDIIILGKALSGGVYPVSAILADDHIMRNFTPGSHGSTYGGNSVACAVAMEALQVIKDENLCEKSKVLGDRFKDGLKGRIGSLENVKELRGRGLMTAMVVQESQSGVGAWDLTLKLAEHGILAKPTHGDTIRFTPPLVITESQIDSAIDTISNCTNELFGLKSETG